MFKFHKQTKIIKFILFIFSLYLWKLVIATLAQNNILIYTSSSSYEYFLKLIIFVVIMGIIFKIPLIVFNYFIKKNK